VPQASVSPSTAAFEGANANVIGSEHLNEIDVGALGRKWL